MEHKYLHLKSGTDIRGTALGKDCDLTSSVIRNIAAGFIKYLKEKTGLEYGEMSICIGHDSRISAHRIRYAFISSVSSFGVKVTDCGLASTPAMFMTTVKLPCCAAVQITASHHHYDKNGLKFFTREGGFESDEIEKVLLYAEGFDVPENDDFQAENFDFMSVYAKDLCDMIKREVNAEDYDRPLGKVHIIVDAGNGAGGFYATKILQELGADITGSQFLEPDGYFPNHIPNPEDETAMSFIQKAVVDSHADFGIIFDTDVDRAACVDENGNEINRNALIALASAIVLESEPGSTVVTDSVTSDGLREFIEDGLGGKHCRFKRGYRNVINEAVRLNKEGINCALAIETSGHAALRENYFLDDGAYLITKIIIKAEQLQKENKKLRHLIEGLRYPLETRELRYIINESDFRTYGQRVIDDLREYCKGFDYLTPAGDDKEGFRVSFDKEHGDGWLLMRLSVHDPVLPLNIESDSEGGADKIVKFISAFTEKYNINLKGE